MIMTKDNFTLPKLHQELFSQDEKSFLEIKSLELPENAGYMFSGRTVHRPVQFVDVTFPPCNSGAGQLSFSEMTFKGTVSFHRCSFRSKFLRFCHCTFEDDLVFFDCNNVPEIISLDYSVVRKHLNIRQCRFDHLHVMSDGGRVPGLFEGRVDIEESSFRELCVLQAHCEMPWYIRRSTFERKLDFSNCRFVSWLYLDEVAVKESPTRVPGQFPDGLSIGSCTFSGGLCLKQVACDGDFSVFDSVVDGSLHVSDSALNGIVTFLSVDKGPRGECAISNVTARHAGALEPLYRYAKVAKANRGDLDASGEFYYLERRAHNAAARARARWLVQPLSPTSKLRTWWDLFIGRGVLGYGEKPWRPLCCAAGVMLVFAVIFWWKSAVATVAPEASSFGACLYFSMVTFTTLGYGDLYPNPGFPRALAGGEAVLGMILMSLFTVVLARKYIR